MIIDTEQILTNWKTTAQSILSGIIGLAAVAPTLSMLSPKQAGYLVTAGAVAKVLIGIVQKDAGTTLAATPSGEVKPVESHETPNDPADTPVVKP